MIGVMNFVAASIGYMVLFVIALILLYLVIGQFEYVNDKDNFRLSWFGFGILVPRSEQVKKYAETANRPGRVIVTGPEWFNMYVYNLGFRSNAQDSKWFCKFKGMV